MPNIPMQRRGGVLRIACTIAAMAAASGAPLPAAAQQAGNAPDPRAHMGRVESYVQDSLLTARVKLALLDAPDVSAMDIGVTTHRGVVQLSGFVDGERLVRRAHEIASRVAGVTTVRNALQVRG